MSWSECWDIFLIIFISSESCVCSALFISNFSPGPLTIILTFCSSQDKLIPTATSSCCTQSSRHSRINFISCNHYEMVSTVLMHVYSVYCFCCCKKKNNFTLAKDAMPAFYVSVKELRLLLDMPVQLEGPCRAATSCMQCFVWHACIRTHVMQVCVMYKWYAL